MKTNVHIKMGEDAFDYVFNMDVETFTTKWKNHITGTGYFSDYDDCGDYIIINPANCGVIVFTKKY